MTGRMLLRRAAPALILLTLASACERIQNIGRPPPLSPTGETHDPAPQISPERVALATPVSVSSSLAAPGDYNREARFQTASLWRSGPTSLSGTGALRGGAIFSPW